MFTQRLLHHLSVGIHPWLGYHNVVMLICDCEALLALLYCEIKVWRKKTGRRMCRRAGWRPPPALAALHNDRSRLPPRSFHQQGHQKVIWTLKCSDSRPNRLILLRCVGPAPHPLYVPVACTNTRHSDEGSSLRCPLALASGGRSLLQLNPHGTRLSGGCFLDKFIPFPASGRCFLAPAHNFSTSA